MEKPDGVFDAPPVTKFVNETSSKLSAVSPNWRCGMIDNETLAIFIPVNQKVLGLSKEKFVDLLEFAEDKLEVLRVLAVFEKPDLSLTEGFPRTLRYVGFRSIAPENHPVQLPADKCFIMCYKV
ncbi:unnamed protein product [Caenorhabditis angaria]|uniref:Ornithine decarboxylase antizyme n=1 Tax=Caenorhabditis angaria TaxID=860376 RepID=A0A9P1I631_9PELO|nr:unnamed protein product [Caenorhabditis angaria]